MKPLPRDGRVILTIENGMATSWKPLIICGGCKWRGPENNSGFASCYWDTPPRKIYPRDFWCKLGEAEEEEHEHTD